MIKIGLDLLIFRDNDIKRGCEWRNDLIAFNFESGSIIDAFHFENIIYLDKNDNFIILKTILPIDDYGIEKGILYSNKTYKKFLKKYYEIKNYVKPTRKDFRKWLK